jgi:exonuclease III
MICLCGSIRTMTCVLYKKLILQIKQCQNGKQSGDINVCSQIIQQTVEVLPYCHNLANRNNPKSNEAVNQMKIDLVLHLHDPWCERTNTRMYTWHNSRNQLSRLDYFLVSDSILEKVDNICIKSGYRSDHSVMELILNLSNQPKGPGLWKFSNSLLTP